MKYLFVLGNHPKISESEIKSLLEYQEIKASYLSLSGQILLVNTEKENIRDNTIDLLGGTIKIAKVIDEVSIVEPEIFENILSSEEIERIKFGISIYINNDNIDQFGLSKDIKRALRDNGIKSSYIISQKGNKLSSAQIVNKILPNGVEFIIAGEKGKYLIAKTIQIQNLKRYTKLDYGIPKVQTKRGMLPPKLAQIMINLGLNGNINENNFKIYDPFCGSGRIVLQSALAGYDIYGSDINEKSVLATKENLKWLQTNFNVNSISENNIFIHDINDPIDNLPKNINAIVTETDLGPAYKISPGDREIEQNFRRLTRMYLNSFENFTKILEKDSKVVFVFPKIKDISSLKMIVDKISSLGYHKLCEFEYSRDYQIVKRHIGVFQYLGK